MTTTATLDYLLTQLSPAFVSDLEAILNSVPLPVAALQVIGVRVISDTLNAGPPIRRRIVLGLTPSVTATATAQAVPGTPKNSPVDSVTVTLAGADYVAPPIIGFSGDGTGAFARALLKLVGATVSTGGASYAAGTFAGFFGCLSPYPGPASKLPLFQQPFYEVVSATIGASGENYSPQTQLVVSGGLCPSPQGRAAVLAPIIAGGKLVKVLVKERGDLYISPPTVTVVDPQGFGSGATVTVPLANMTAGRVLNYAGRPPSANLTIVGGHVTAVAITDAGRGLIAPPVIAAVDLTGAGSSAVFTASCGVGEIQILNGGKGFSEPPDVVITPAFKAYYPDGTDQQGPFYNLITSGLRNALGAGVAPQPPVIA